MCNPLNLGTTMTFWLLRHDWRSFVVRQMRFDRHAEGLLLPNSYGVDPNLKDNSSLVELCCMKRVSYLHMAWSHNQHPNWLQHKQGKRPQQETKAPHPSWWMNLFRSTNAPYLVVVACRFPIWGGGDLIFLTGYSVCIHGLFCMR